MSTNFTPITDEQRAQAKIQRKIEQEYARKHLFISSKDEQFHRDLGAKLGVRMPFWWIPCTETKYIRRSAKKLGINLQDFVETTGFDSIKEFCYANSELTAFTVVGLMLEWYESEEGV